MASSDTDSAVDRPEPLVVLSHLVHRLLKREGGSVPLERVTLRVSDYVDTWQEYLEVAGELLQTPAMMIHLAMREHDRQTTEAAERVLEEGQQRLSDELKDIIDLPGIEIDSEATLSDGEAQRIQDHVQQQLDEL